MLINTNMQVKGYYKNTLSVNNYLDNNLVVVALKSELDQMLVPARNFRSGRKQQSGLNGY